MNIQVLTAVNGATNSNDLQCNIVYNGKYFIMFGRNILFYPNGRCRTLIANHRTEWLTQRSLDFQPLCSIRWMTVFNFRDGKGICLFISVSTRAVRSIQFPIQQLAEAVLTMFSCYGVKLTPHQRQI